MTLTRWSPLTGLAAVEIDSLNRMFDIALNGESLTQSGWVPPVDILETAEKDVIVKAELPEMKREEIKVAFENNVLTIEGERTYNKTDETRETYHRVERGYGAFRRTFTMPSAVDASRIEADYRDGVLTVKLPRREESRPRQIQVNG
jgi:HSP20 family protein